MESNHILKRIKKLLMPWQYQSLATQEFMNENFLRLAFSIDSLKRSSDELWIDVDLVKLISFIHAYQNVMHEIDCSRPLVPENIRHLLEEFSISMDLIQKGKAKIIFYPELETCDIDQKILEIKRCLENSSHIKKTIDEFSNEFRSEYLKIKSK
jgi:hypothetical protein